MLTNNKKNFVRSIAVVLAMLMVLAVCLTGCGNKAAEEALTKADAAQNAADAAQGAADAAQGAADAAQGTADEAKTLAEEVKAALANYLLSADLESKVDALIDAALADGAATKADVEALAAELEAYIAEDLTKDEITALIKAEVAANAVKDAMTKDEIIEILKGYYTKDELTAKLDFGNYYTKDEVDAKFESFFGELKAEQVYALLKDVEKVMDENKWDDASDLVISTIKAAQDLLTKTVSDETKETYLQANMKAVNAALSAYNFVAFKTDEKGFLSPAPYAELQKHIEYMILRQATPEDMAALLAAIDAALAVPTFQSEQAALLSELFALGEYVAYGSYGTGDKAKVFTADKYTAAAKYHGKDYAKDADKETQVVTLHDKADFYTWNADLVDLLTVYVTDETATGTTVDPTEMGLTVSSVWVKSTTTDGVTTKTVVLKAADLDKLEGYTNMGLTVANETYCDYIFGEKTVKSLEDTDTILVPELAVVTNKAALLDPNYHYVTTDYKNSGKYGYDVLDGSIFTAKTGVFSDVKMNAINDTIANVKWDMTGMSTAYSAIVAQLTECLTHANYANTIFEKFQKDVIWADSDLKKTEYAKVTDAQLVDALTSSMCEPGQKPYDVYLTDIAESEDNVTTEMEQAIAVNGDSTIGIDEYDLYLEMLDRAYDLLWTKYRRLAQEWADKMLLDYISLTYEANDNTSVDNKSTATTQAITVVNGSESALITLLLGEGERASDELISEGFIDAYLNGKAVPSETGEVNIYKLLDVNFENKGLELFYRNNGTAAYAKNSAGKAAMEYGYYYANPLYTIRNNDEDIRDLLADAMRSVDIAIAGANRDQKKADGILVQKAFYEYLIEGIANLEEVYDRFLITDYAYMLYNNMVGEANALVDFYGDQAGLKATVQKYLYGNSYAAGETGNTAFGGTVTMKDSKVQSYTLGDVTYTSATIITNGVKKTYSFDLKAGQMVANINSKTNVNPYTSVETKTAEQAMKAMDEYYEQAYADVENMVIKVNFLGYIDTARGNLDDLDIAYWIAVRTADIDNNDLLNELNAAKQVYEKAIVNIKYYADRDVYELDEYKAMYIELLAIVAGKDNNGDINPHLALRSGKATREIIANADTIATATFDEALKQVKSSQVPPAATESTVIEPVGGYEFVGDAAVAMDILVNGNATYKVVENSNTVTKNVY